MNFILFLIIINAFAFVASVYITKHVYAGLNEYFRPCSWLVIGFFLFAFFVNFVTYFAYQNGVVMQYVIPARGVANLLIALAVLIPFIWVAKNRNFLESWVKKRNKEMENN